MVNYIIFGVFFKSANICVEITYSIQQVNVDSCSICSAFLETADLVM